MCKMYGWFGRQIDIFLQGLCGHLIRKAERLNGKGRGLGNDGYKHAGAYSCAAGAPEPAGPAGNAFSSSHHFH